MTRHSASVAPISWLTIVGRAVRGGLRPLHAFRTALAHRREVRCLAELDDRALKDIGMPADGLERAAALATQNQYPNPRPIEIGPIRELLRNAYEGRRPGT